MSRTRTKAPSVLVVSHACVVDVNQEPFAALAKRGLPVHVIAPKRLRTDVRGDIDFRALDGVHATALPIRIGGFLPGIRQAGVHLILYRGLGALVERLAPDVLYAEEEPWSLTALQVARIARRRGIPFAFHQSQNVDKRLPLPFERIRARVLREAAGATVRLDGPSAILRSQGFGKPLLSIPNTIEPARFDGAQAAYGSLRRPVLGFVGRLVEEKGVLPFVRAAARAGAGSVLVAGDGPLLSEAKSLAASLGVHATFAGAVAHDRIAGVFASIDVLAIPSHSTKSWKEQFGRVVIEANAAGVPVVATECGALGDTVRATGGGLGGGGSEQEGGGDPPGDSDAEALAAALARLASDETERRRLGDAGRAAVRERFTAAAVAAQLDEFFTHLKEKA